MSDPRHFDYPDAAPSPMSETTKRCVMCGAASPSECAGPADRVTEWQEPCGPFVHPAAPSPEAGEREDVDFDAAGLIAEAHIKWQGTYSSIEVAELLVVCRAYLALRRAPRVEAGEWDDLLADLAHRPSYPIDPRDAFEEAMRRADRLTAALRTGGA